MGFLFNPQPVPIFTAAGDFARGAKAFFYSGATTVPIVTYQDTALEVAHPWPVVADLCGVLPPIWLPYGPYRRKITTAGGALISDVGDIPNPAPPDSGGDVVVTSASQLLQTGQAIWMLRKGTLPGFVRMNGNTIGNPNSGATELASDDAQALFSFLWTQCDDDIAPVTGGRGASAGADWGASKKIVVPTMQARVAAGLDDMGGSTSEHLAQAITTCTADISSTKVTVASADGLAVGMYATIKDKAQGKIAAISGTEVTLAAAPTVAGANLSFRGSWFPDARRVGASAGVMSLALKAEWLPAHKHAIEDKQHSHAIHGPASSVPQGSGDTTAAAYGSDNTGLSYTGITETKDAGGGQPMPVIQPTRLGTFFMKL
ncbi:hypothetical protein [Methylocella sp.]|uniref:hypothetical protein n=1 Tax=Methylocella sp. TaxID=1978226 RepID=UPI003784E5DF